jgi:phosphohistidine phosphatase
MPGPAPEPGVASFTYARIMKLFLMRHSHALTEAEEARRPLSARGREVTRSVAGFLRAGAALAGLHAVWYSPLLRARQTAELLAKELGLDVLLIESPGLLPEDDPMIIADRVERLDQEILIVGHETQLSALATLLVRDKLSPPVFDFKKSGVLALEKEDGRHKKSGRTRWLVRWLLSPELLPGERA